MHVRYYVGEWLVEPEQNRLVRGSESAKLEPKSIQVLAFLARHPNEVLTKDQIIGSVWEGTFVSDEVLTTAIWGLRKALGDDAKEPRYIQTIPRRGYRLIAPVERAGAEAPSAWEPSPYPGLSAFSQRDAQYFYGREQEVEALWKKLHERNLLALIGPSGAGKSSLLRAGVIPKAPEGWGVVLCQPRTEALESLSAAIDASRDQESLWIVDPFEELFTLRDEETQKSFAELLGRAASSGVHVLLSMRDDFLIRCHAHPCLEPVFDKLTPITALEGAALRRALTEPARASGYRFEDEALVAEILTEVSRERGALPLLAFAASKLWEKRDRERHLLTREAYLAIGGVAGALAQHAEETLSSIGAEHEPIVREIFRNLTTASGTRVPMDREELLTVFRNRDAAEGVLGKLIDARLLTSAGPTVEVIHESLVTAWPRLVRWQAQNAEGAVLRDQLRQAARAWQERGRREDLLWTGTSYRELALWRERHPGGLTATEEEFVGAATRFAENRRRRRRIVVAALLTASIAVAVATSSLWRISRAEALRAEASKLLALGQLEIESNPTAALAYAIKSLELADTSEARQFALQTLQQAPTGFTLMASQDGLEAHEVAFSDDGRKLAVGGYRRVQVLHRDGGTPVELPDVYPSAGFEVVTVGFLRGGHTLVTNQIGDVRLWDAPGYHEIERKEVFEKAESYLFTKGDGWLTPTRMEDRWVIRWWPDEEGASRLIGTTEPASRTTIDRAFDIDPAGRRFAYTAGHNLHIRSLEQWDSPPRILEHDTNVLGIAFHPDGESLAASDESGEIRIWSVTESSDEPLRVLEVPDLGDLLQFSPEGRWLAAVVRSEAGPVVHLWDLMAPPGARPILLKSGRVFLNDFAFDPTGEWLVVAEAGEMSFWPLGEARYPRVLEGHDGRIGGLAFTPDGSTLLSASSDGTLRAWPLREDGGPGSRVLLRVSMAFPELAVDPGGRMAAVSGSQGKVYLVPLSGGPARELEGFSKDAEISSVAFSPDGRRVAAGPFASGAEEKVLRIWDLESGAVQVVGPVPGAGEGFKGAINGTSFLNDHEVLVSGLVVIDLLDGEARMLGKPLGFRTMVNLAVRASQGWGFGAFDELRRFDLKGSPPSVVVTHGPAHDVALDPTGTILATGGQDGIVRIGPVSGEEPHVFFGHRGLVRSVRFSPDGRWLASAGEDRSIRLWPVPDVTEIPPHQRGYKEFLSTLRSWTNARVVPDTASATGWKIEFGPFPGWAKLP